MARSGRRGAYGCAGLLAACVATATAEPAVFDYAVSAGADYSDNVGLTAVNQKSSVSAVAGLDLYAKRPTGRFQYLASGDLTYYHYFAGGFPSQLYGQLNASTTYDIVPGSFQWMAAGSYGQARQDLLQPAAPGNLQNIINLSTGPTLTAHFGQALEATLNAQVSTQRYSKLGNDNTTVGGQFVLGHRSSATTLLGIGESYDNVTYSGRGGIGAVAYKRNETFLRYNTQFLRTLISADVGYAKITGANRDSKGPLARVRASRRLTPFLSAFVDYHQEYPTSQAYTTAIPVGVNLNPIDASALTSAPRLSKNASAGLLFAWPRTSIDLTFNHLNETAALGVLGQRTDDVISGRVTRALSPRSSAGLYASYTSEDVPFLALKDHEQSVGAELSFSLGGSLSLDIKAGHRNRSSSITFNSYSELDGGIALRYGRVRQPLTLQ